MTCVMYFECLLTPLCVDFEKKKALYFVLKMKELSSA